MSGKDTAKHFLDLAAKHLKKVEKAWDTPTDWDDLTTYGLYCLEALIKAAAIAAGKSVKKTHGDKAAIADKLHQEFGVTDVADLMRELNDARKANAYGDTEFHESDYNAEDIASQIEAYYDEIKGFVEAKKLK